MSLSRWYFVFSCFGIAAVAQTPDTATIRGRVLDQSHASVSGVRINAKNTLTGFARSTETDLSGWYSLRSFRLYSDRITLDLRAEAFNVLNHANFVGYSSTYGNGVAHGPGFRQPLPGITNQLPARSLQFEARFAF